MRPKISVIIVTFKRAMLLKQCLKSLAKQTYGAGNFEVVVINDGSKDSTEKIVKSFTNRLNIKYLFQNHQGIGSARNRGVANACEKIVAFIDDDCIATEDWLRELAKSKFTSKIVGIGGRIQIHSPKNLFERFSNYNLYGDAQNWQPTITQPPFLTTCNAIFVKEKIVEIGGFDPNLSGPEDLDLGWRLFFKGFRFNYNPRAVVYHVAPKNYLDIFRKNFIYGRGNSRVNYKNRYELRQYRQNSILLKQQSGNHPQDVPYLIKKLHFLSEIIFKLGFRWQNYLNPRNFKRNKIKIASVYQSYPIEKFQANSMDTIRWLKISEELSKLGYRVDMITNERDQKIIEMSDNLRRLPYKYFRWQKYDVIKTVFQSGFESLDKYQGTEHPFIIAKTTVVGPQNEPGVYFEGQYRERLFEIQRKINEKARFITILSSLNKKLWIKRFGDKGNILLVPTGVDKKIPPPQKNPFKNYSGKIALFVGHLSNRKTQKKLNLKLQKRLNELGKILIKKNIRLCFIGNGDVNLIDPNWVTYLGSIENDKIWDYHYFADCGIALAHGPRQNFESSKIYYYLRAGLPVVSESPIPNNYLITEARLGYIVPYNQPNKMAKMIEKTMRRNWNKKNAVSYMVKNHTWKKRVTIYDDVIINCFKH